MGCRGVFGSGPRGEKENIVLGVFTGSGWFVQDIPDRVSDGNGTCVVRVEGPFPE